MALWSKETSQGKNQNLKRIFIDRGMGWHWTGEPLFSCLRDGHNDTNCVFDNATAALLPWRSFSHARSTCVHPFATFQPIFKCYRFSWAPLCFFVCRSAHVSVKWSRTHRHTSVRKSVWTFSTKKFYVHIVCTYSIKHYEISSFFLDEKISIRRKERRRWSR